MRRACAWDQAKKVEGPDFLIVAQFDAPAIKAWRDQLLEGAAGVFGENKPDAPPPINVKELHAKIGQLALENDFLSGALGKASLLARAKR